MIRQTVVPQHKIYCNRCDQSFPCPKLMTRDSFCGQKAARLNDFCTCPHCGQTDHHWVYAAGKMPKFEGNFDNRKKAERKWLREN